MRVDESSAGTPGKGTYPSQARLRLLWTQPMLAWLDEGGHLARDKRFLDYGCGLGDFVDLIADRVARADGFDIDRAAIASAAARRRRENSRFFSEWAAIPAAAYDIITVSSVLQYFSLDDLSEFFSKARQLLRQQSGDAFVLISDIVPPEFDPLRDAWNSLTVAMKAGATMAMGAHLGRSVLRMRRAPLKTWSRPEICLSAERSGFSIEFLPHNLTPSRQRYSCIARPRGFNGNGEEKS